MELNATWSPNGAHSIESWLTQGSGATPSTREASYELQIKVANPSPAWLLLCPNSKRDRRSCPSWNFLSGTHSQASTVTLFLPKRQSHVSIAQTNVIAQYTFSVTREPLRLPGALPKNDRYSFSNETRGSLTDCPNLPLLHSALSIAPSK